MSLRLILAGALALAACGQEGVDDAPARRVGPEGDVVGVRVMDLTEDGQTYVVDVNDGRPDDGLDVIGRDGARVPARDWLDQTSHSLKFEVEKFSGEVIVFSGIEQFIDVEEFEDRAGLAGEGNAREPACPPTCMHCPEQSVMFCASLCGGR